MYDHGGVGDYTYEDFTEWIDLKLFQNLKFKTT